MTKEQFDKAKDIQSELKELEKQKAHLSLESNPFAKTKIITKIIAIDLSLFDVTDVEEIIIMILRKLNKRIQKLTEEFNHI